MTTTPPPAPGWYADPWNPAKLRWWDGSTWTQHTWPAGHPTPTGQPAAAGTHPAEHDPVLHWTLPIGRSALAIAAGYLGLFSVCAVPAPIAIVVGVLALRDIAKHPEKKGRGRAWFGVIMGVAGTLLLAFALVGVVISD